MLINFIGAGNVAWHLAQALHGEGCHIGQIYSRTLKNARALANIVSASFTNQISEINDDADIYILSIKDDVVLDFIDNQTFKMIVRGKLIVHTAGSISMSVLENLSENTGVLYPLQTFSKHKEIDFRRVPVCIEANSTENLKLLKKISEKLLAPVYEINSEQRQYLHLAAVFACNFTNHFYVLADDILQQKNISFDILKPLIKETADKIKNISPKDAQTGPAVRNDKKITKKHLKLLSEFPELQNLYSFVSNSILNQHHSDMDNFKERLKDITSFVFDVDGVFSDFMTLNPDGELLRSMNVKDGYAVKTAVKAGYKICIITGGDSLSVKKRFEILGVEDIYLASHDKIADYRDFCEKRAVKPEQILYMGDDIPDYQPMKLSGLATCPADACEEIQSVAHYISDKKAAKGCVRDVIEQVMRAQGKWFKPE